MEFQCLNNSAVERFNASICIHLGPAGASTTLFGMDDLCLPIGLTSCLFLWPNLASHARNLNTFQPQQVDCCQWCRPIVQLKLLHAQLNIAVPRASEWLSVVLA